MRMKKGDNQFPGLVTKRLRLRALQAADESGIFVLRSDPRVLEFLERPRAETLEDARAFIQKIVRGTERKGWLYWVIARKRRDTLIGTICLWNFSPAGDEAEIGYELLPDFQGRGYMQEAVAQVTRYGFEVLELEHIYACLSPENKRSVAVLEKSGFIYKGSADKHIIYVLVNSDFKNKI